MDYEFVCKGEGLPVARLAMGQEAFGHWLNDEKCLIIAEHKTRRVGADVTCAEVLHQYNLWG